MVRSAAAGGGVPYELLAADLSQVNYSSARLGLEQFKRRCRALQRSLLVAQFLEPVWRRFVTLEVLSGRLDAPDFEADPTPYFAAEFLFPAWTTLDPLKETKADLEAMRGNIRSRFEIISSRGRDPQEVDAEIAADPLHQAGAPAVEEEEADDAA